MKIYTYSSFLNRGRDIFADDANRENREKYGARGKMAIYSMLKCQPPLLDDRQTHKLTKKLSCAVVIACGTHP